MAIPKTAGSKPSWNFPDLPLPAPPSPNAQRSFPPSLRPLQSPSFPALCPPAASMRRPAPPSASARFSNRWKNQTHFFQSLEKSSPFFQPLEKSGSSGNFADSDGGGVFESQCRDARPPANIRPPRKGRARRVHPPPPPRPRSAGRPPCRPPPQTPPSSNSTRPSRHSVHSPAPIRKTPHFMIRSRSNVPPDGVSSHPSRISTVFHPGSTRNSVW